jgi:N-acetylglutamate synthase-like GNAT family acetyltransferase
LRSGIFPENAPSLALHARHGFREVGVHPHIGFLGGAWRDVVLMERRSPLLADMPLVRVSLTDDAAAIASLLRSAGLRRDGVDGAWRVWVADAEATAGAVIGCAAVHRTGDTFLLRSVAVQDAARRTGIGRRLVAAALTATDLELGGPATVTLLTETAAHWFARIGFRPVERGDLPPAVALSPHSAVCTTSAQAMIRGSQPGR